MEEGKEIMITTHKNMGMPVFMEVIKLTDKAVQLKNNRDKTVWIPKTAIKFEDNCYYITDWFRGKMELWQLGRFQD